MIIDIKPSQVKNKRYRATVLKHNGETQKIDFGLSGASTWIDGMSLMILWGKHKSLEKNVEELNKLWKLKYKSK